MTEISQSETNSGRQYYVLLVGINDYPSPISKLRGCLNDINRIEQYLFNRFRVATESVASRTEAGLPVRTSGPLHICRLDNEQATHANIIKGFRQFLQGAGPDDVVWFHFSGHGSEEYTAEEFLPLEPNGKDQTLLCHPGLPENGPLHLADKELAVLLHEVGTQDLKGESKESPHIVVSLDCCHSGSGTRDFEVDDEIRSRQASLIRGMTRAEAEAKRLIRSIDSYADGYYGELLKKDKPLEVPLSAHALLSACESVQLAGDKASGGVFTMGLIDALAGGDLNYFDLYIRTRAFVQKIRREDQTPKFEVIGGFNAFTRFLDGAPDGRPQRYEVVKEGKTWLVKCGAIHGVPMDSGRPVAVEIWNAKDRLMGKATLTGIGAQKSSFTADPEIPLQEGETYYAVLRFLPAPPVLVWAHGAPDGVEVLREAWDDSRNIRLVEKLEEFGEAQLEVAVSTDTYSIRDRRTGRQVKTWSRTIPNAAQMTVDTLGKMVFWERTIELQHEKSAIKNWLEFELDVTKDPRQAPLLTIAEAETIIEANAGNFIERNGTLGAVFIPRVKLKNVAQELYFYLLHLRANYAISAYEGEVIYRPGEHDDKQQVVLPLWKTYRGWGLDAGETETTSYFKLLVTTEALDYQQLLQDSIEPDETRGAGTRGGIIFEWEEVKIQNDWYSVTRKVTLRRS